MLSATASLVGKIVHGCQLEKVLGQGGMATVYLAEHLQLRRKVVVKVHLRPDIELREVNPAIAEHDREFVKRFQREARAQARLSHPNIATIFDVGTEGDLFFIVMEFIDGPNLLDYLTERVDRLTEPHFVVRMLRVFLKVAAALEHAHDEGMVHRDLKPENVMLSNIDEDVPTPKLIDFGLVRIKGGAELTKASRSFGTLYYMSPEQHRGAANVDLRTDVYGLAAILFPLLSGGQPFVVGEDLTPVAAWEAVTDLRNRRQRFTLLPQPSRAVLMRMLAVDVEDRCADMAEFIHLVRFLIHTYELDLKESRQAAASGLRLPTVSSPLSAADLELRTEDLDALRIDSDSALGSALGGGGASGPKPRSVKTDKEPDPKPLRPAPRRPGGPEKLRPAVPSETLRDVETTGRIEPSGRPAIESGESTRPVKLRDLPPVELQPGDGRPAAAADAAETPAKAAGRRQRSSEDVTRPLKKAEPTWDSGEMTAVGRLSLSSWPPWARYSIIGGTLVVTVLVLILLLGRNRGNKSDRPDPEARAAAMQPRPRVRPRPARRPPAARPVMARRRAAPPAMTALVPVRPASPGADLPADSAVGQRYATLAHQCKSQTFPAVHSYCIRKQILSLRRGGEVGMAVLLLDELRAHHCFSERLVGDPNLRKECDRIKLNTARFFSHLKGKIYHALYKRIDSRLPRRAAIRKTYRKQK